MLEKAPAPAKKSRVAKDAAYYREWRAKDKARKAAEGAQPEEQPAGAIATANDSVAPVAAVAVNNVDPATSTPDPVAFQPALAVDRTQLQAAGGHAITR
jgi:hypothetical protein